MIAEPLVRLRPELWGNQTDIPDPNYKGTNLYPVGSELCSTAARF